MDTKKQLELDLNATEKALANALAERDELQERLRIVNDRIDYMRKENEEYKEKWVDLQIIEYIFTEL